MSVWISREQVVRRVREAKWKFSDQSGRVEIYKRDGGTQRMDIPRRDYLPESLVRIVLKQAGLSRDQIEQFLKDAVKEPEEPKN